MRTAALIAVAVLVSVRTIEPAPACTIITLVADGHVWFANNEDFVQAGMLRFVPGADGKLGRVNVGFEPGFAQGSMNEKGLCFDAIALGKVEWKSDPAKKSTDNIIELIMDRCATVPEALAFFDQYNCHHLAGGQFMFADAEGNAAVVAWVPNKGLSVVHRTGDYLIATTRLEESGYRCPRFTKAEQLLGARKDGSLTTLAAVLGAVQQRGPIAFTTYSTIYDLKAKKIYLYNLTNFNDVVEFDLATELAKGRRIHLMSKLVSNSPTIDELKAGSQRVDFDTRVEVDDATLDRYVGAYRTASEPPVMIHVARQGRDLKLSAEKRSDIMLFPESETRFRIAPNLGQVSFQVGEDGTVAGLTIHRERDVQAARLQDK